MADTSIPLYLSNTMFDYYLLLLKQYMQIKEQSKAKYPRVTKL